MTSNTGIWVDHRKAVIVFVHDQGEDLQLVTSDIDDYFQRSEGKLKSLAHGRRDLPAFNIVERDYEKHLSAYYSKVMAKVRDSEHIYIFGPGPAKIELKGYFEKHGLVKQVMGVENAEKLNDRHVVLKVREFYKHHAVPA